MKRRNNSKIAPARIEPLIFTVRGRRVLMDSDLASIYGVTTARLNEQVKRNVDRFPEDFCHQLTAVEWKNIRSLRSQIAILDKGRGKHRKYPPYVFTEHGAIMVANILKTPRAVQMSVFVVRAFVRLREMTLVHEDIAGKLAELERRVGQHDAHIQAIIEAIRQLMAPPARPKREMGFRVEEPRQTYSSRRKR